MLQVDDIGQMVDIAWGAGHMSVLHFDLHIMTTMYFFSNLRL